MDPSSIFNFLQDHIKRLVLNFLVTMPFWVLPLILFKPNAFLLPVYVQISLIFCLSVIWHLMNIVSSIYFQITFWEDSKKFEYYLPELISLHSIFFVSVFVLIGYYFKLSFIDFLILSFGSLGVIILMFIIFSFLYNFFKK